MWRKIKSKLAVAWQAICARLSAARDWLGERLAAFSAAITTQIDWPDVCIHLAVSSGLTLLIGYFGNPWYGAAIACTLFYGREQAQQGDKDHPPLGWKKFVPVYWGPHGQAEFLPLLPVCSGLAWALTWLKASLAFHP